MQQQQQQSGLTHADTFWLLLYVSHVIATCFGPLLRRGQGEAAYGWNGIFAGCLLIVLAGSIPGMGWYLAVWFLMLLIRRAQTLLSLWRGKITHTRYQGAPWLAMLWTRQEPTAIYVIEPLGLLLIGLGFLPFIHDMGLFFIVGGVAHVLRNGFEWIIERRRLAQARDALIEQHYYADRLRR